MRRVLIVDDNPDNAAVLQTVLELGGHVARVARDLPGALAAVSVESPDVVLLDLAVPRLEDGFALARRLRTETGAYIVALTGYGRPEDRRRAAEAGCHVFVLKPADVEQLFELIDAAPTAAQRRTGA